MRAQARLAAFIGLLGAAAVAVLLFAPVSRHGLRDALEPFGVAAPLAYVAVSVVLGNLFVPGPILAGASGLLFGTLTGFFVTVAASVLGSVVAVLTARAAGRDGVEALEDPRARALEGLLRRRPVVAVAVQRLLPAVPDAPFSYLFGLAGLRAWQVALGTLIGSTPRAFSYTALGNASTDGASSTTVAGVVVLVVTSVAGAILGAVLVRNHRRA